MSQKDKEPEVKLEPQDLTVLPEESWEAPRKMLEACKKGQAAGGINPSEAEPVIEGPRQIDIPVGYKVVLVLGLLWLAVWGVMKFMEGERTTREHLQMLSKEEELEREETEMALKFVRRLDTVVGGYLTATTLEEKTNYVRQSERVAPLMKKYYEERPMESRQFQKVEEFVSLGLDKRSFMLVKILLSERVKGRKIIHLVVEETEEGQVLVDWESDVAYQPISLGEYISNKPKDPVDLRLFVSKDNFYNFEFSDAERYLSLKLGDRDSEHYLFGYVERGSGAHEEIEKLLEKSEAGYEPALLRVRFLPGTKSKRSVLVEKVVEPRWIHVDDPRDSAS